MSLAVGLLLDGHLNGRFGRDHYGPLRVEAYGVDWIVGRDEHGRPLFAQFDRQDNMQRLVDLWIAAREQEEIT